MDRPVERDPGQAHGDHRRHRGVAELEDPVRALIQAVPDRPRDPVRDHGIEGRVADLVRGQPGGRPVRGLLVLGQLEAAQELAGDLGQAQAAALRAERQARQLDQLEKPAA